MVNEPELIQGRRIGAEELAQVQGRLAIQPPWSRWTDTLMGLSSGNYGFGHEPGYMRQNGLMEVFAHAWTALVDKDQEFATLFSGVIDAVRRILKL